MDNQPRPISVVLLTQQNCVFCDQAKDVLARLETEYALSVSTVDLHSSEGQSLAENSGILFPPGIFLDGEPFSYGRPSEKRLRRAIERRAGSSE
jgi:glutaredoxin